MLLNGEAIFGVVDFHGDPGVSSRRARIMAEQAQRLGVPVCCQTIGSATLGFVGSNSNHGAFSGFSPKRNVVAVAAGECLDRQSPESFHTCEPARSLFLAEGNEVAGNKFLLRLDGIFATALWNKAEQELILACDWRGDGRVYYASENSSFVFSSWLPLLAGSGLAIDRQAAVEFLRFLYIAAPKTIYRGTFRLKANHYLIACRGKVETRPIASDRAGNEAGEQRVDSSRAVAKFDSLFDQAIRRRIGDRRVGVLLSSGIDSAALTAGCHKVNPGRVKAFTVGFDNSGLDETSAARALAKQIGVPHTELRFGLSEYRAAFSRIASGFDQPFGDPVALALVPACAAVGENVDVIADGTGSDGAFGSPIPRHLKFALNVSAKMPYRLRTSCAGVLKRFGGQRLGRHTGLFDFDDAEELFITWAGWNRRELSDLLGTPISFADSGFYKIFRACEKAGPQGLYDSIGVLPPDDARFEAAGLATTPIELPYHDYDLWNFVRSVPAELRMTPKETKVLLRQWYGGYASGQEVPAKKRYFNIPMDEILRHSDFELIREHLGRKNLQRHGIVDPDRAWKWIGELIAGGDRVKFKVWALLMLHAWLDAR